ncbi:hypothetical protein KBA41_10010, partial [Candidatus Ozemobacteraceae bacterium]|nr:hypothetical protein [Candidatus Ozemobacteraceae bacterium]
MNGNAILPHSNSADLQQQLRKLMRSLWNRLDIVITGNGWHHWQHAEAGCDAPWLEITAKSGGFLDDALYVESSSGPEAQRRMM